MSNLKIKTMKKIVQAILPLTFVILILPSCNQEDPKIGLSVHGYNSDRWTKDKDFFVEEVTILGGEVLVRDAQNNPELQYKQAKELIDLGVDVLVVIPEDFNQAANIVKYAHQHNVKVISYDRLIKNCKLDYYVSFDNINVGEIQAEYVSEVCSSGNFALVGGPVSDNNSLLIRLGQMTILQPLIEKGSISLVFDKYAAAWTKEEGYRLAKMAIEESGGDISAILAASDGLADGVVEALKEYDLEEKVCVSGQDADLEACKRVLAGTQTMTVYKPIRLIANTAAQLAMKLAKEEAVDNMYLTVNNGSKMVPAVMLQSMVVNAGTIEMTVIEQGFLEKTLVFSE
jgi:D-xylose transport system substrate-binding protein